MMCRASGIKYLFTISSAQCGIWEWRDTMFSIVKIDQSCHGRTCSAVLSGVRRMSLGAIIHLTLNDCLKVADPLPMFEMT
jgi:hypothetical protein